MHCNLRKLTDGAKYTTTRIYNILLQFQFSVKITRELVFLFSLYVSQFDLMSKYMNVNDTKEVPQFHIPVPGSRYLTRYGKTKNDVIPNDHL